MSRTSIHRAFPRWTDLGPVGRACPLVLVTHSGSDGSSPRRRTRRACAYRPKLGRNRFLRSSRLEVSNANRTSEHKSGDRIRVSFQAGRALKLKAHWTGGSPLYSDEITLNGPLESQINVTASRLELKLRGAGGGKVTAAAQWQGKFLRN